MKLSVAAATATNFFVVLAADILLSSVSVSVDCSCPHGGCDQRQCDGHSSTCDGGDCNQDGLSHPSCGGGHCSQRNSDFASCEGGGCNQDGVGSRHPYCGGGNCSQQKASSPRCLGGCDQSSTSSPLCGAGLCCQNEAEPIIADSCWDPKDVTFAACDGNDIDNYVTAPLHCFCVAGGCDQRDCPLGAVCVGGKCDQRGIELPLCIGGYCNQASTRKPCCIGGRCCQDTSTSPSCVGGHCEDACAQFDNDAPPRLAPSNTESKDSPTKAGQDGSLPSEDSAQEKESLLVSHSESVLLCVAGVAFLAGATTLVVCQWCWKTLMVKMCSGSKYSLLGKMTWRNRTHGDPGQMEMEDLEVQ